MQNIVDLVCKRDDEKIRMYAMSLFMLDYYAKDPHPSIRSIANYAKKKKKNFSLIRNQISKQL